MLIVTWKYLLKIVFIFSTHISHFSIEYIYTYILYNIRTQQLKIRKKSKMNVCVMKTHRNGFFYYWITPAEIAEPSAFLNLMITTEVPILCAPGSHGPFTGAPRSFIINRSKTFGLTRPQSEKGKYYLFLFPTND